jgi:hypothetical protein
MKDLIEQILKYLPQYLLDFGAAFSRPKTFIANKNVNTKEAFGDALLFLAISLVLSVLIMHPLDMTGKDLWVRISLIAVAYLILIPLFAVALRASWWIVGGHASVRLRSAFGRRWPDGMLWQLLDAYLEPWDCPHFDEFAA